MYVILGASGHTGSSHRRFPAIQRARRCGCWARSGATEALLRNGAEACTANVSDAAALTKALSGAGRAYLMLPPLSSREEQERQSDAIAKAVKESGLQSAVHLSSFAYLFRKAPGQSQGCILRSKN